MKFFLLLALSGCAVGSTTDPESLKDPPLLPQRDPPEEPVEIIVPHVKCTFVRAHWGGNCVINEFICDDGSYRLDSRCYPPDWKFPWEDLPDPPAKSR